MSTTLAVYRRERTEYRSEPSFGDPYFRRHLVAVPRGWGVALELKWADVWIGCFWQRRHGRLDVWLCLLPCLPVHWWLHTRRRRRA